MTSNNKSHTYFLSSKLLIIATDFFLIAKKPRFNFINKLIKYNVIIASHQKSIE